MECKNNLLVRKGGVIFAGILGTLFVILKFANILPWHWVWVLSPFWITFCLYIVVMFLVYLIVMLTYRKD